MQRRRSAYFIARLLLARGYAIPGCFTADLLQEAIGDRRLKFLFIFAVRVYTRFVSPFISFSAIFLPRAPRCFTLRYLNYASARGFQQSCIITLNFCTVALNSLRSPIAQFQQRPKYGFNFRLSSQIYLDCVTKRSCLTFRGPGWPLYSGQVKTWRFYRPCCL